MAVRMLGGFQRRSLLVMTGACKTVSTDILQIVAKVLPLDLEIRILTGLQLRSVGWIGNENIP